MSYKLEQNIVPPPGTDTTVACDFEISESSSKLPAFFPRKTKCTPAGWILNESDLKGTSGGKKLGSNERA